MSPLASDAPARPQSLSHLFFTFTGMALQGFGGVMVVVQRVLVEDKQWLTREQFLEDWAVAQIMPGPNVINLAIMIGAKYFGWRGAVAACTGLIAVPLALLMVLAVLYANFSGIPAVSGAVRGMGAVAAGLIIATGLKLAPALKKNVLGLVLSSVLATSCFIAVALLRLPMIWVLPALGGLGVVVAYRKAAAK